MNDNGDYFIQIKTVLMWSGQSLNAPSVPVAEIGLILLQNMTLWGLGCSTFVVFAKITSLIFINVLFVFSCINWSVLCCRRNSQLMMKLTSVAEKY